MTQVISIDAKTVQGILTRLDNLASDVATIKAKLLEKEPPYGSDEWWEWSDKKALEDIKAGRYIEVSSEKELKKIFKA